MRSAPRFSVERKLLSGRSKNLVLLNFAYIEAHSLGDRTALACGDDVAFFHLEARRAMYSNILVALLEAVVLLDVVEIVAADDDCSLHLGGDGHAFDNSATDAHVASERALLVHKVALFGLLGRCEAEPDISPIACCLFGLLAEQSLRTDEHGILLLESFLSLIHCAS